MIRTLNSYNTISTYFLNKWFTINIHHFVHPALASALNVRWVAENEYIYIKYTAVASARKRAITIICVSFVSHRRAGVHAWTRKVCKNKWHSHALTLFGGTSYRQFRAYSFGHRINRWSCGGVGSGWRRYIGASNTRTKRSILDDRLACRINAWHTVDLHSIYTIGMAARATCFMRWHDRGDEKQRLQTLWSLRKYINWLQKHIITFI